MGFVHYVSRGRRGEGTAYRGGSSLYSSAKYINYQFNNKNKKTQHVHSFITNWKIVFLLIVVFWSKLTKLSLFLVFFSKSINLLIRSVSSYGRMQLMLNNKRQQQLWKLDSLWLHCSRHCHCNFVNSHGHICK